ncbi:MAG: OmpH family outer membrane protein [Bacteroidetes bacterium]|nr:OmpH family outer membrane protein [Bacteroidota bacterium]
MKKNIVAILVALVALTGSVNAQQKIGHINSLDVLEAMPEFKAMNADVTKQKESYTKVLEGMYGDYDKKQKELQGLSQTPGTPDAILETKIQELQQLQERIQVFENKVNEDLQKLQVDKMKPINDKYLAAVKEVAKANGYSYVIDIVSGAVAYYPEDNSDVTDLVMKKLGITRVVKTTTPVAPK